MIKIDFHIHTVSTPSDSDFDFDMERLQEYVTSASLGAIAITNHNMFDVKQFEQIEKALDIAVYPGIEINLDTGHLLLISNGKDHYEFLEQCSEVECLIPQPKDSISVDDLHRIFGDLRNYILIPHYEKKPPVSKEIIEELSDFITAGEVMSPKKFMYCQKDDDRLVPVYFSDSRMSKNLTRTPVRQTYLGCGDASFSSIKNCLQDKLKVSLSSDEGRTLFQIFDNGQQLSTGLNVVIGERSSGKTYILNKIYSESENIYSESENVRYIKQFSLVARDDQEDERKFDKLLSEKHSLLTLDYLGELRDVVIDIIDVDIDKDAISVSNYIESLVKHAAELERHDSFSKSKLCSEEEFSILDQKGLRQLINSTQNLIENIEFRKIIEKHVLINSLKELIVELMQKYLLVEQGMLKQKWVNEIVSDVKVKLQTRTATTIIKSVDLYSVAMNLNKVNKFNKVVNLAKTECEIERQNFYGYEVVANSVKFKGASDLKKLSKRQVAFSGAFAVYGNPYSYLQQLKNVGLEEADLYKFFVNIEYKILNKDGFEVSGGERSEFNLLQEIQDAQKYDMLLIDEPESSFDNQFLLKEVNEIIKDISKNMPVVLVTHNNTVGASIRPEYLLCTKKKIVNGKIKHQVYSGYPASKELVSLDGEKMKTFDVTMDCLEAGEDAYNERGAGYENLKD